MAYLVSGPRGEERSWMPGPTAAGARDAPVRAVVLSVGGGRRGLVDGRRRSLRRPRDALHDVVVGPQFHLEEMGGLYR